MLRPIEVAIPHDEAAKHSAVNVALLRLADKGVLHGCVTHEHGILRGQGWHVNHSTCLTQQRLCPLLLLLTA